MLNGTMAAQQTVIVDRSRMGFVYDGALFLARPDRSDSEQYRREIRSAYGGSPIRFVMVPVGMVLRRLPNVHGYEVPETGLEIMR